MAVIDIQVAMDHVRADDDDQAHVALLLAAAESASATFLQRNFYADSAALAAAQQAVPAQREAIRTAYNAALQQAEQIENLEDRCAAIADAKQIRSDGLRDCAATARGLVLLPDIEAACLLTLGHLYANREDVVTGTIATKMPFGARVLLDPHRIRMGV